MAESSPELGYLDEFEFPTVRCCFCNGYYGPSFEEPLCSTCHAFIFPDDLSNQNHALSALFEITDDGDSGNDEPSDPGPVVFFPERRAQNRADPRVQGRLVDRVDLLSRPRDPDDLSPVLIECLPPEVLLVVFSYLDDISLWSVANVCKRWQRLLEMHVSDDRWLVYTCERWPLFKPLINVNSWYRIYSNLIESSPCRTCLQCIQYQPSGDENSWRSNRLQTEMRNLRTDPPEGIQVQPLDKRGFHWQATITGPAGSPFEGGIFFLYLQVPNGYPMNPPIVRFITKIFHPNVSRHGDVGIDSIQHNWSLVLTISKVLISIQSLLTDPYCGICMEPEVGRLYLEERGRYEAVARAWTWRFAMHDALNLALHSYTKSRQTSGLMGRGLVEVLPNVSPATVAGILRGISVSSGVELSKSRRGIFESSTPEETEMPLRMPATVAGETLGRSSTRPRPISPEVCLEYNTGRESLRITLQARITEL